MTGVCGMKKERACWRRAWGTHKSSLYKTDWALDDGRALWLVTDFLLLRNIPMWRSTLCSRGHGAKERCARREGCEEGHSCQRAHKLRFSHRMTQRQRVFAWGWEPEGSCKVLYPSGRGRHCWKSDETGRLSGLLVAVLDNQPTDKIKCGRVYCAQSQDGRRRAPPLWWDSGEHDGCARVNRGAHHQSLCGSDRGRRLYRGGRRNGTIVRPPRGRPG